MKFQNIYFSSRRIITLQLLLLTLAVGLLYGNFLSSPLVFDDRSFVQRSLPEIQKIFFSLDSRWLPYSSFNWTRNLPGESLVWWRLGNLALHIANTFLLFLLLRRLFAAVLPEEYAHSNSALPLPWLAFFGALIFALHPVAVYGVAYLVQRSILMATMFALLTWLFFCEGLLRNRQRWLLASAATYLLAVLSKEHAIMTPAVCAALLLLLHKPDKQLWARVGPTFLLYGLAAAFLIYQFKSKNVLGYAYEPDGVKLLSRGGVYSIDQAIAHPLSILTQSYLYFKYFWLWLVPNPAWMSVDMLENFATRFWTWPETAGLAGFIVYPLVAAYLLLKRGSIGLLGFALLCPWLLFATELSTVRIQEVFVLYRSYLWMPCLFAALPFLLQKLSAKYSVAILFAVVLAITPVTWNRLTVFSDPVLLWDDAMRVAKKTSYFGTWRIYHSRGMAYLDQELYPQAIQDLSEGIRLLPNDSRSYTVRGVAYLKTENYTQALIDFNMAIQLDSGYWNPYLGRAQVYEALGNPVAAMRDYAQSCQLGVSEVCAKAQFE